MKFIVLSKRSILSFLLLIVIILSVVLVPIAIVSATPKKSMTIIIDAGHGGEDGGSVGYSGTIESDLNLEYAFCLKKYVEDFGYKAILTRDSKMSMLGNLPYNKKDDMKKREEIINNSNADLVISLHMNSFPLSSSSGAQVFYNEDDQNSIDLANAIQKQFISFVEGSRNNSTKGNYYILNCTDITSVIVECGFISNSSEEQLLLTEKHKNDICYSILCGILLFFDENRN